MNDWWRWFSFPLLGVIGGSPPIYRAPTHSINQQKLIDFVCVACFLSFQLLQRQGRDEQRHSTQQLSLLMNEVWWAVLVFSFGLLPCGCAATNPQTKESRLQPNEERCDERCACEIEKVF